MAFVLVSNAHVVLISQRKHVTAVSKDALPTCFLFQPSCVYMKARVNEPGRLKWAESTCVFGNPSGNFGFGSHESTRNSRHY